MGGGIFADQIFWPYFIERPLFYQYRLEKSPIYLTEKKEIYIRENELLVDSFNKVEKSVISTKAVSKSGVVISGSGLIITNDGLIITLAQLVPQGYDFSFFVNGESRPYQVLKRDTDLNLALIKLEGSDFYSLGFKNLDRFKNGERVFLVGSLLLNDSFFKTVNEGIIKRFDSKYIYTNISESSGLKGSVLFDIQGDVAGINLIDKNGEVFALSSDVIKSFAGF